MGPWYNGAQIRALVINNYINIKIEDLNTQYLNERKLAPWQRGAHLALIFYAYYRALITMRAIACHSNQ